MYLLVAIVGSLVVAAIIIMIVSKVRTINKSKGRHEPLPSAPKGGGGKAKGMSYSTSIVSGIDGADADCPPGAFPMLDLATTSASMPGPSGLGGGCGTANMTNMDLEILTNSSSLYDDSTNLSGNLLDDLFLFYGNL